ncbi:MAG: hypothetical protein LH614_20265 [Pyrinomonadaceae bacterium]|nr:hypothetical protein [Pyrinomonadaceae bacterium]
MTKNTTINACLTQTGIIPKTTTEVVFNFNQKEKIMKNLRNMLIGLVGLLFILQLTFVSTVQAQNSNQAERERLSRVMDSSANVEEFRQELTNYFTEMEDVMRLFNEITVVREKLNKNGLKPLAAIAQAKLSVANATPEDLRLMREVYAKFPGWRAAPQNINALIKPELRRQLEIRLESKGGDTESNFVTPDNCADGINADVSNTDISAAEAAVIAAEAIQDAIPPVLNIPAVAATAIVKGIALSLVTLKAIKDDCTSLDATAVQGIVDGAKTEIINNDNGNTSTIVNNDNTNKDTILTSLNTKTTTITGAITNAKTDIINNDNSNKTMLTTTITNAQTSINNTSTANTTNITTAITNAQTAIVNNDNSNKTMIVNNDNANALTLNTNLTNAKNTIITNDNTNTTNIVNNDNSNKTMIVNNANANTTTLINNGNTNTLALNDLILRSQIEADLAEESSGVKVGWYMTPTAFGGKLDLVQQIVTLTLANIQAAGGNIGNAQSFLTQANADKAAGNFKSAYDNYRKAYKAAVK